MYTAIEKYEIHGAKKYLACAEDENFRAFSDTENPQSYESNYAVLKNGNLLAGLARVDLFFAGMKAQPKLWSRPDSAPLAQVRGLLEENGWNIWEYTTTRMLLSEKPSPMLLLHKCEVKVFAKPVTGDERLLLSKSYDGRDYGLRMIDRQMNAGAKLFAAYSAEGAPVSMCVANVYGSMIYVENVYTLPQFRRQGYAASVLTAVHKYAVQADCAEIFLDAEEEAVCRLYRQLGFAGETVRRWWAFKGELPLWMQQQP